MRRKGFTPLIIILVIAILGVVGYFGYQNSLLKQELSRDQVSNPTSITTTQLQFNQEDVYKILVEMKKSENERCGGPCTRSVDYVRAMNANYAVVEAKGIDGPGAYYIYKKNNQNWVKLTGGQESPTKNWLNTEGIPVGWFY